MLITSRIDDEKPDIISGITDIVKTFRRNVFTTGTSLQFAGTSLLSVFILQSLTKEDIYSINVLRWI
jgi:hypothetical protein